MTPCAKCGAEGTGHRPGETGCALRVELRDVRAERDALREWSYDVAEGFGLDELHGFSALPESDVVLDMTRALRVRAEVAESDAGKAERDLRDLRAAVLAVADECYRATVEGFRRGGAVIEPRYVVALAHRLERDLRASLART